MDGIRKPTALVLIPGVVNYFYNLNGRRMAEALSDLGFQVEVSTLTSCPPGGYDCCVLAAPTEVLFSVGNDRAGLDKLRALRRGWKVLISSALEAVGTPWFDKIRHCCEAIGVDAMLDLGFHDQGDRLAPEARAKYHFIMAGLTTSELRALDRADLRDAGRTIPWAFVGHSSQDRVALVAHLVGAVDPRGFVYIPQHTGPCTEKGSPHLNQRQFERVLRHTRYQIWCSHHGNFYMESERFRMSLLAGGVPIKVVAKARPGGEAVPFDYLMIEREAVGRALKSLDFEQTRRRFREDFRRLKVLKAGLADYLVGVKLLAPEKAAETADCPPSKRAA